MTLDNEQSPSDLGEENTGHSINQITIDDVARLAQVSVSTVSRILNNKPDVAPSTRQRVQHVIKQLGYAPHSQAQRLAARKSRTIAFVYPFEYAQSGRTYVASDFIVGVANAAGEEGYGVSLVTVPVTETNLLGLYRSAHVDGIILMEVHLQDWRVDLLRQHNHPFVMIGRCADNTNLSFIDLDFEKAVLDAFDLLVEAGHRQIAFLNYSRFLREQGYGPAVRCLWGYELAQQKYRLNALYQETRAGQQEIANATLALLKQAPDISAIITVDHYNIVEVIRTLQQQGRRVPEDVSLVSLISSEVAHLITPPITTINFRPDTVAYQAAKMLIANLEKRPIETKQLVLPPELTVRQSTGPVKR